MERRDFMRFALTATLSVGSALPKSVKGLSTQALAGQRSDESESLMLSGSGCHLLPPVPASFGIGSMASSARHSSPRTWKRCTDRALEVLSSLTSRLEQRSATASEDPFRQAAYLSVR
jgi:hypothetical protein